MFKLFKKTKKKDNELDKIFHFVNSQHAIIIGSAGPGRKGITVYNEMDVQRFFEEENYLSPDAQKWIRSKITEYPCEIWDLVLLRQKEVSPNEN